MLSTPRSHPGVRAAAHVALAWTATALVTAVVEALPARAGEPLPLRWLRVAAENPLRSALALALLLPWPRPPAPATRPGEGGGR